MKTLKDLFKYLNENNISYYNSKKPGVVCINGKNKKLIENVSEVNERDIQVWESCLNNIWTTFIKNSYDRPEEEDYMSAEESKHWEMDAYEYDGDPDKFDEWREGHGY